MNVIQKRFQILGTSIQKFDLSTSWSLLQCIARENDGNIFKPFL